MRATDDVRSTYSKTVGSAELITWLDDEQRAVRPAAAHVQDKQSAPSNPNMPPSEAPVIWGLKEGTGDEWGAIGTRKTHVETDCYTSGVVLALWWCLRFIVDAASNSEKWHRLYDHGLTRVSGQGPWDAELPLTASWCTIVVQLRPLWYHIKGNRHEQHNHSTDRHIIELKLHKQCLMLCGV